MTATTISIRDDAIDSPRRVTKIVPYQAGGFAVVAPYHAARRGYLAKMSVDYREQEQKVHRSEMEEYSASDRVKLSFHPDGFVQFSGETQGRIVSGRDPLTTEPRGLGILLENPLSQPILSGPTFSLTVWGLEQFATAHESVAGLVLGPEHAYLRGCLPGEADAYAIEGFLFPQRYLSAARMIDGHLRMSLACMSFEAMAGVLEFAIVPLPGQSIVVGIVVSRIHAEYPQPSGFALSSPSDRREGNPIAHTLVALYPEIPEPPTASLDYRGSAAAG